MQTQQPPSASAAGAVEIKLGDYARDRVTRTSGIVTAIAHYLRGRPRVLLEFNTRSAGPGELWVEADRLELASEPLATEAVDGPRGPVFVVGADQSFEDMPPAQVVAGPDGLLGDGLASSRQHLENVERALFGDRVHEDSPAAVDAFPIYEDPAAATAELKRAFRCLFSVVDGLRGKAAPPAAARSASIALTHLEAAGMFAVKAYHQHRPRP